MKRNRTPLEKLVRQAFAEQTEQKREYVKSLGYKNINKGYEWLYRCLRSGEDHRNILKTLPEVFGIDEGTYDIARQATRALRRQESRIAQLEEELEQREQEVLARRNFRPYLYVRASESTPTCSIFIYAFANWGKYRYASLPEDNLENSLAHQKEQVGKIIHKHFREYNGLCPGMGYITGYYYRYSYDAYLEFDSEGNFERSSDGQLFEGRAVAMIKNKTIASTPV